MSDRRLDDDGTSVLASAITATATSIPVSDAQWTTDAGDYPLQLLIGGELITATGISTAGTQTFTGCARSVNRVTKAHAAGTQVRVARAMRLTLGHAVSPPTPLTGTPPPAPTPPATPEVPTTDLELWIDAGQDDTAADLAGQGNTAQLGSTAGSDAQDPAVAVAANVDVWDPDGSDDYIDSDYTPTFTPTTGAATLVFIGVYDSTDTAGTFTRAVSAESANSDGINITFGGAGDAELWTTVGGATTLAFARYQATDGLTLTDGELFMVAATVEAGALRIYEPGLGLSAPVDITGVGTITLDTIRFFRPTDDTVTNRAADSPMHAGLVYSAALTQSDLDSIATAYGLIGGAATGAFRTGSALSTPGTPDHVLSALGSELASITRSQLDGILDDWVTGTGGTTRNVTSAAEWTTAMAAAEPGDLIRVTSSFSASSLSARGNLYGLSGTTMTTSPSGGTTSLPVIVTCADGVTITGTSSTGTVPVLDVVNTRHVWAVGFNVAGPTQFGIRFSNAGGASGAPAYLAYCTVHQARDWSISARGWFQDIASSGGTPPGDDGGDRGFSEFIVIEANTITDPNPTDVAGNPGEGIYLGDGSNPDWEGYARDVWCRGNYVTNYKANAYECKPGCRRIRFTDNLAVAGRGQLGAPFELCYLGSAASRPAWADDVDFEIYCEANRVYDFNITETGTSRNYFILLGIAGVRIANNLLWSLRNASGAYGTGDTFYGVLVGHESLTTDFGDATSIDTWVVNNNIQARGYTDPVGHSGIVYRNNIVPTGYDGGTDTAGSSDYTGTTPAVGALSTADAGGGAGSAFELDASSALIAAGDSISDLSLAIAADILNRPIPASNPNPGPFQSA